jgi:hypothetical protein
VFQGLVFGSILLLYPGLFFLFGRYEWIGYTRAKSKDRTSYEKEGRSYERIGHNGDGVLCAIQDRDAVPRRTGLMSANPLLGEVAARLGH